MFKPTEWSSSRLSLFNCGKDIPENASSAFAFP